MKCCHSEDCSGRAVKCRLGITPVGVVGVWRFGVGTPAGLGDSHMLSCSASVHSERCSWIAQFLD